MNSSHTPALDWAPRLVEHYPVLADLPEDLRHEVLGRQAQHLRVPAGATLFEEHAPCQGFPMLLSGEVRVARGSKIGRAHV